MQTQTAALEKSIRAISNTHYSDEPIEGESILIPVEDVLHYSLGEFSHLKRGTHYAVGKDLSRYEAAIIVRCGKAAIIRTVGAHVYMTTRALDTLMGRN